MLKLYSIAAASMILLGTTWASAQAPQKRNCGTMEAQARLEAENPELKAKQAEIEAQTSRYIAGMAAGRVEAGAVTIPVVVHVVYRLAAQNISDAQILSQINTLNADYSKTNADASLIPSLFAPLAANSGIAFCLAKTSPTGAATTGIIRKSTTVTSFSSNDAVKRSANGGDDAWDASKYLNIWVCNLGGGLLGYAQFPGGAASTDGVVILFSAFGNSGSANAPYNIGRTATHEVGHWLNLRHIWGDASCGNDQVNDTPTQSTANYGCPSFPKSTCSNTSDMFMNYMDYTDDACMYMFSTGQAARMNALFAAGGSRTGFTMSTTCGGPVQPTTCDVPAGLASASITSSGATVSWASVAGAASYAIRYRAVGAATWTSATASATSLSLAGLVASTAYEFQVQSVCGGSLGSSAFSASSNFSTVAASSATYCAANGNSTADEWIASFAFGTISNASTGQNSAGYQDFTSLAAASVTRGSSYTATYKTGFRSGYSSREYYQIYADWNADGDFADAGETVVSRSSTSANNLTSTITVPITATVGATRVRILMKYGTVATSSCGSFSYGQVEDYKLNIVAARASSAGIGQFVASLAPNPASETVYLNAAFGREQSKVAIRLVDMQGKALWSSSLEAGQRIEAMPIPIAGLRAGLYMVQLVADGATKVLKLRID